MRWPSAGARQIALAALSVGLVPGGCTEPNPYLPASSSGAGSSGSSGGTRDEGSPPTETEAEPSSTSHGGETSCASQGHSCIAPPPQGFAGPVAWIERPAGAPLEACPEPFGLAVVVAFSELSAPPAQCNCACGAIGNAGCGDASIVHLTGSCAGAVQDTRALAPGCNVVGGAGWTSSSGFQFDPPLGEGGCIPLPSVERPPATFLTRHTACAGSFSSEGCAFGKLCVPTPSDPFHARWCVWRAGDVSCPGDDYPVRTVLYDEIEDERGCEQCTCAVPSEPCTGAAMVLSTATNCASGLHEVPPGTCEDDLGGPNIAGVLYVEGDPPRACEPAAVVPKGEATATEPVTLCCSS